MLKPPDKIITRGHSYRHILKGVSTAVAGKGIAALSNFFAVPLTVRYLGAERYGVWITLTSILAYLTVFDLGIGSTAINKVAEALAAGELDAAKSRINTAYLTLTGLAVLVGAGVALAWPLISWPAVLGAKSGANGHEITAAAAVAVAVFLAGFPFSATPRIMGACHEVSRSNYWASAGSVLSLLLLVAATRLKVGLPGLVLSLSGAGLIVGVLSTIWLYRHFDWLAPAPRSVSLRGVRELLGTGLPFFAVQLSGIVLFQTDNLIIAQILGARSVTPYSVTWKLFSYASLLQVMALPALWPAYADAFARRDFSWIRKTYKYNLYLAFGSTFVFSAILLVVARRFIAVWAGPSAVPSFGLVAAMAAWAVLSVISWSEICLLGAAGRVKGQAIYSGIGAVVNVIASIWMGRAFGLTGIILGTLIAYSLCIIVPQTIEVRNLLREN